ncbi:DUF6599 family protein [Tunturiibacter lichenicola]|jgi:hypothetical protein|uniref:DUF6599 family protein n=1 Tax=Tunturiibacter lichenicola TaxID=2051959 RepID=UPI003D9BBA63
MGVSLRMRVMVPGLLGLSLVGASGVPLQGQQVMLAEPPTPLLPVALRSGPDHDAGEGAPSWSGAAQQVLIEDGIKRYERGTAESPAAHGTAPGGTVTVYQFVDATGAAAAYDYLRKSAPYVVRSGVSVVVANLKMPPASAEALMRTVETGLPKVGGPKGLPPLLPTYLPAKGLAKDSQHYALGPVSYQAMGGVLPPEIVGFDKAAEVVTAKYEGKGTLTMLLYPTPQIAGDHLRQIEAQVNQQGGAAGTVMLRREGPLVLLTTGAWNPAEAQKLVEGIHLRSEVTWNKPVPPEFHAEIRKTVSLLTSILVFCGVGALAAVVLALFLGGGRAAIRVLQGKPAATEPEFLRIDLSGGSARIKPEIPGAESRG